MTTTSTIVSGQTSTGLTVSSGEVLAVNSGGVISTTSVAAGGVVSIVSGGQEFSTIISSGGSVIENAGAFDSSTTILASGSETVSGSATGDQIYGTQNVSLGGALVTNETVFGGGALDLFIKSATAIGTTVSSGGFLNINGNATASNTTLSGGATIDLQSPKAVLSGSLDFVGGGNVLEVTATTSAGYGDLAVISHFAAGDAIDAATISASSATLSLTASGGDTVATIASGAVAESFIFAGTYTSSNLILGSDGNGGAELTDVASAGATTTVTTLTVPGAFTETATNTLLVTAGGSISNALVDSGAFLVIDGGAGTSAAILAGGSLVVGNSGTDASATVYGATSTTVSGVTSTTAAGTETVSSGGSVSGDLIYGVLSNVISVATTLTSEVIERGGTFYEVNSGVASGTEVLAGGQLLINGNTSGVNMNTVLVSGGYVQLESAKATVGGTLTFSGGDNILAVSATTSSGYGDQAVITGFTSTDKIDVQTVAGGVLVFGVNSAGNETVTLSGTHDTFIFSGTSAYDSATLSAVSDGATGTDIELVSGSPTSTTSSGTSGSNTFTVSSGQTSNGLAVSAGETLIVQAGGTVSSTAIQTGGVANISGTDVSATVSTGGSATVSGSATGDQIYGGVVVSGAASSETVENGGLLTIVAGTDTGTTISAGGNETVLASATGDAIYGTQLVSAATAVVTNETVYAGGNLDLFLKGGVATSTTVSSGGTLQISGNATIIDTTLVSGGVLELESPKTVVSGTLTFVGAGNEVEITGATSAGYGDPATISGFTSGNVIDITSTAFAPTGMALTEAVVGGDSVATVTSGGATIETFTFAGVVNVGLQPLVVNSVTVGEDVVWLPTSVVTTVSTATGSAYTEYNTDQLIVVSGGVVSAPTIDAGGFLVVNSGADVGANIVAGGLETVLAGSASNDVIAGSAVVDGGTVADEQMTSGGALTINGGEADTILVRAGQLTVSGGVISNVTLMSGGVVDLATTSATLSGSLTFSGGDNTLATTALPGAGAQAVISGFSSSDKIDIGNLGSNATIGYASSANNTEIVTVSGSLGAESFTFDDQTAYGSGTMALIPDSGSGVDLVQKTTPVVSFTSLDNLSINQPTDIVNGTVDIADDPEAVGATVAVIEDGQAVGTAIVQANGYWSANVTFLNDSSANVLTATDTDLAGQTGTTSSSLTYNVNTAAATFNTGDLIVSVYGDGSGTGNYTLDQAAPISLDELTRSGTIVSQIVLPETASTVSGVTENEISGEYGSASEGQLQLSADGHSLTIMGYGVNDQAFDASNSNAVYGSAGALGQSISLTSDTSVTLVPRVVADINASGVIDTSTALYNIYDGNNPRSVATVDGSSFYLSGQGVKGSTNQGVFYAVDGASSATAISTATDTRAAEIYDGQLYVSADSTQGATNITDYGSVSTVTSSSNATPLVLTGLGPTVTLSTANGGNGNTANLSTGTFNLSPYSFYFANSTTLYVADGGLPKNGGVGDGGLQKWSDINGTWTLDYTLTAGLGLVNGTVAGGSGVTGLYGLTGSVNATTGAVTLYATSSTQNELDQSYLFGITDTLSDTTATQASSETFTTLMTAAPDTIIRGVSFAPTACYARGTKIATARGEIAIEDLRVGDLALIVSGARRPIVWIGHRALKTAAHPAPEAVWPVRIAAHAFGDDLPQRDLWVSPGHNIAWDGALIPACALVNGHTVTQVQTDSVEYWHIELDAHDVVLAEGLAAESYLDCGNREHFANGGEFVVAHPDFLPKHWAETCLPLQKEGAQVAAAKTRLLERLAQEGLAPVADAAACVIADGERIEPMRLSEQRLTFFLPEGKSAIELTSRVCAPAWVRADAFDTRELGLCVARLQIDGVDVALAGVLDEGWREAEYRDGAFSHRWTAGAAPLPAGARVVIVDLAGDGLYWPETAALLFAQAI